MREKRREKLVRVRKKSGNKGAIFRGEKNIRESLLGRYDLHEQEPKKPATENGSLVPNLISNFATKDVPGID